MRYAIVDNSTLTAVQRLLGEIEVVNDVSLDGDIAAFETFVQSILFYDQTFYIDDYKPEFRQARKNTFSSLVSIESNTFDYGSMQAAALAIVNDISLQVTGGKIKPNEIGKFLEQLRMHTTFTWDMRSSSWFLTMKMLEGAGGLDLPKYSALNDMIFLELTANRGTEAPTPPKDHYSLLGSDGQPIPKVHEAGRGERALTKQVSAFAASLNWLASRTAFYTYFSYHYGADALLHPIRSAFQVTLADRLGLGGGIFQPIIQRLSNEASQVTKDILQATEPVVAEMTLPIFSAYLVERAGNPQKAIDLAFQVRQEKPFIEARRRLIELEALAKETTRKEFVKEINSLVREVKSAGDTLRTLYGVTTKNGVPISPLITVVNFVAKLKGLPTLPNTSLKVPAPDKILDLTIRNGFKGVIRSVTQDLVAISQLGHCHQKLTSSVKFKDGKRSTYLAKTENVKFRYASSSWKKPM